MIKISARDMTGIIFMVSEDGSHMALYSVYNGMGFAYISIELRNYWGMGAS